MAKLLKPNLCKILAYFAYSVSLCFADFHYVSQVHLKILKCESGESHWTSVAFVLGTFRSDLFSQPCSEIAHGFSQGASLVG
jgi:hypothetical protein